jgi:hypothetical protein
MLKKLPHALNGSGTQAHAQVLKVHVIKRGCRVRFLSTDLIHTCKYTVIIEYTKLTHGLHIFQDEEAPPCSDWKWNDDPSPGPQSLMKRRENQ